MKELQSLYEIHNNFLHSCKQRNKNHLNLRYWTKVNFLVLSENLAKLYNQIILYKILLQKYILTKKSKKKIYFYKKKKKKGQKIN